LDSRILKFPFCSFKEEFVSIARDGMETPNKAIRCNKNNLL
jgi:hypothetical protein